MPNSSRNASITSRSGAAKRGNARSVTRMIGSLMVSTILRAALPCCAARAIVLAARAQPPCTGPAREPGPMQPRSHSPRSTLATWSAALLRAVEARGADANAIARELGLDRNALGADARVPRETLSRLWMLAVAATGDP